MAFPNQTDKYRSDPIVTPEKSTDYVHSVTDTEMTDPPSAVILCYSRSLMEHFADSYDGQESDQYYGDLYVFEETDYTVGVLGNFGIGAPATAMVMDDLVADGVDTFLSIGHAGCLSESVEMGEFIVCSKAIRDEGTSHHYVESEKYARPSDSLVETIRQTLREREEPFHVGPSWTTDAVYRETKAEIEQYAGAGVLTVEMEASAVFTVADHRGVDAGAMFVVSDYLGLSEWEPNFHLASEDLRRSGDTATTVLMRHRQ